MEIREERRDGVLVVAPSGRVDSVSSGDLEGRLLEHLTADRRLVVDFRDVEYISSAGLRVLLMLAKKLRESGGELVLCSMDRAVRMTFELAGFLPIFVVVASREEAFARLSRGA
jgi:anti-sigma B factor antagonist/stage II sporulation protein AA (anti-sigma F factor antagonist)